jgi:hypothetical protein
MVFSPESAFDGGWSLNETENPEFVAGWVFKATTIGEALDRQLDPSQAVSAQPA